jgi:hypothetical protein
MATESPEAMLEMQLGPHVVQDIMKMTEALVVADKFDEYAGRLLKNNIV